MSQHLNQSPIHHYAVAFGFEQLIARIAMASFNASACVQPYLHQAAMATCVRNLSSSNVNFLFHLQVELSKLGFNTRYNKVNLGQLDDATWQGIRNKYWHFDLYFLPVCTFSGTSDAEATQSKP